MSIKATRGPTLLGVILLESVTYDPLGTDQYIGAVRCTDPCWKSTPASFIAFRASKNEPGIATSPKGAIPPARSAPWTKPPQ